MTIAIILTIFYIIGYPIILRGFCALHTNIFIKRKMDKMPKSRSAQANLPKPIWPGIKEKLKWALQDTRPLSLGKEEKQEGLEIKKVLQLTWAAGAIASFVIGFIKMWTFVWLPGIIFFIALGIALRTAAPIIQGRAKILQKMFDIGKSTLGLSAEYADQPQAVIQILEWRETLKPSKVKFEVPTNFNADSSETFQKQFNQVFGVETTWVPFNDPDTGAPGWDFENGTVTLFEMPPLPQMAPWSEHYVLDPSIAWSFFPLALGVENGVPLTNPNTGEEERVLGFDVSGEQAGLSKKLGVKIGGEITTSPMALVAGGTGGGKSLSISSAVRVIKQRKNKD